VLYDQVTCVIGNGVVIGLPGLFDEFKLLDSRGVKYQGRFLISDRAHLLFDFHKTVDGIKEISLGKDAIGTTKQGIGPCYANKMQRIGLRVGDLKHFDTVFIPKFKDLVATAKSHYGEFHYDVDAEITRYREFAAKVSPMVIDTIPYLHKALAEGKRMLVEGANALMLDIDYGTYPYVTSSSPCVGGIGTGLGIPPQKVSQVIGIVKAYTTRVGFGPFPTEETGEIGEKMRSIGKEFGTTTGRARRCGWLDIVQLRYAHMVNGITDVALTKLDILTGFPEIKVATKYSLNGHVVDGYPGSLEDLQHVQVTYETFPGWKEDIAPIRSFDNLPQNAKNYVFGR